MVSCQYAIIPLAMTLLVADRQCALLTLDAVAERLSEGSFALFRSLRGLAAEQAAPVYLVGGPVRDLLLGGPAQDLDFAVVGDAPSLARQWAIALGGRAVVHSRFGTATLTAGKGRVDLVTARREVYPRPGGLPQVFPGTIYDDLARRDFAVNAMAWPLTGKEPGLLAPHGGAEDLRRRLIRILHPASFLDDPTRMLRAARYEQRLGFCLERDTESRLREGIAQGCINTVSGDRLRHELARIFAESKPGPPLLRAAELGILAAIYPPLESANSLRQWAENGPAIVQETGLSNPAERLTWLAALAYPLSEGEGAGLISRLNMPKSWAAVVRDTLALREQERAIADRALPASRLCQMLAGRSPAAVAAVVGLTDSAAAGRSLRRYLVELRQIVPALRGADLLALGVPPGPPVGAVLAQLRAARQDGQVNNAAEERQWVARWLRAGYSIESLGGNRDDR